MKQKKNIKIDETNIDLETVVNNCVYSTAEQKIGKWIDNKPIYRKVLYTPTTTGIPSALSLDISNLDSIVYINVLAIQTRSAGGYQYKEAYYGNNNDCWRWWINNEVNNNAQFVYFTGTLSSINRKWQVIVEYTKTTD